MKMYEAKVKLSICVISCGKRLRRRIRTIFRGNSHNCEPGWISSDTDGSSPWFLSQAKRHRSISSLLLDEHAPVHNWKHHRVKSFKSLTFFTAWHSKTHLLLLFFLSKCWPLQILIVSILDQYYLKKTTLLGGVAHRECIRGPEPLMKKKNTFSQCRLEINLLSGWTPHVWWCEH